MGKFGWKIAASILRRRIWSRSLRPFTGWTNPAAETEAGSGLGLYIAKTILEHHGIPYKMENMKDGVRFSADFAVSRKEVRSRVSARRSMPG